MKTFRFRFSREELEKLGPMPKSERMKQFNNLLDSVGLTPDKYYVVQGRGPFMDIKDRTACFLLVDAEEIEDSVAQLISPKGEVLMEGITTESGVEWSQ